MVANEAELWAKLQSAFSFRQGRWAPDRIINENCSLQRVLYSRFSRPFEPLSFPLLAVVTANRKQSKPPGVPTWEPDRQKLRLYMREDEGSRTMHLRCSRVLRCRSGRGDPECAAVSTPKRCSVCRPPHSRPQPAVHLRFLHTASRCIGNRLGARSAPRSSRDRCRDCNVRWQHVTRGVFCSAWASTRCSYGPRRHCLLAALADLRLFIDEACARRRRLVPCSRPVDRRSVPSARCP